MKVVAVRNQKFLMASMLIVWVVSLFLPVVTVAIVGGPQLYDGLWVLTSGFLGPMILQFGWFANLLIIPAAIVVWRGRAADRKSRLWLGLAFLCLAFNTMFWGSIADAVRDYPIIAWHVGYFAWMAAIVGMGVLLISSSRQTDWTSS